jgi:hypothetical protein
MSTTNVESQPGPGRAQRAAVSLAVLVGMGVGLRAMMGPALPRAEAAPEELLAPGFPAYDHARFFPVGDEVVSNGLPMKVAYFTTHGTTRQVFEYYEALFQQQRLTVDGQGTSKGAHLTAVDLDHGEVRSVTVNPAGDHLYVFCSVSSVGTGAKVTGDEGDPDVALPADAELVQHTRVRDGSRTTYTTTFVADSTAAELRVALEKSLGGQGWRNLPAQTKAKGSGTVLEFERQGGVARVVLAPDEEGKRVAAQIHTTYGEGQ